MAKVREGRDRSYSRSLREYARGIVGGLLFSLPLLYTMEVWWAGFIARPFNLLLYLSAGFLLLFGDLQVELGRTEPRSGGFAVPVTVHNRGGETAEGVQVEVELAIPGAEPERAELDIAFIPRQSKREGWVTLRSDPAKGRLTGRAMGYEKP